MATIEKYVNSGQNGNDGHTGDDAVYQPWLTIQHGVDWFRDHKQPGDTGILNIIGAFQENASMVGNKYSNITIQSDPIAIAYDPAILTQYCEARPQVGGDPASGTRRPGIVFKIERADGVVLHNLTILLAECGVDADHAPNLTLDNCCIHGHISNRHGAGFTLNECDGFEMKQCRVWCNKARLEGGGGALRKCQDADIAGSLFYLNEADETGGALYIDECDDVRIAGCTIGAPPGPNPLDHVGPNQAKKKGGGVGIRDGTEVVFKTGIGPLPASGNVPTRIDSNTAGEVGGGIFILRDVDDCSVTLDQQTDVVANKATDAGRGVAVDGGDNAGSLPALKVLHSLIHRNRAEDGGGVFGVSLECTIQDTRIYDNRAKSAGGGIFITGDDEGTFLNISANSVVNENRATSGAGISGLNCPINVEDSRFLNNFAQSGGGGIDYSGDYVLEVDRVEFNHNTAPRSGGGISSTATTVIYQCRFILNEAEMGAGLNAYQARVDVEESEFTQNTAKMLGGGCWIDFSPGGTVDSNKFITNNADEGAGLTFANCDLTVLTVTGNQFDRNKDVKGAGSGADILSYSTKAANPAALIAANTFTGAPDVVVK